LLQAFLYKKLDAVELSYLHEDVGLALEELYGDGADGIAVQLAHHFELAGEDEKACHYLQRAAEGAAAGHANRQAAEYFTKALALSPKGDQEARYSLLIGREQVYDLMGERALQTNDLDELEKLANTTGKPDKLADVSLRRSQWAINRSDYAAAIRAAEKAGDCAKTNSDRGREAAAHRLWGSALREKGDYEAAKAQFEQGRDLALAAQSDLVWARCLHELGAIAYFKSNFVEARISWQKILEMYRQKDDRRGQALALRSLGIVANQVGDFTAAHKSTSEALDLARTVGDRQEESRCLTTLANTARHEGDLTGAQRYYEQSLGMYQQLGNRAWEGLGLMNLGYVIWEQGNFKKALSLLEQAFAIQEETGNRWAQASCLENLGMATRDLGKPDQASIFFRRALDICRELGLRDDEVSVLIETGIAADDLGDWDAAREAFEKALKIAEELGQKQAKTEALAGLAQAAQRTGDLPKALERVSEIVIYLEKDPGMTGSQRPLRVHLICFKVFAAANDERAIEVLRRAHAQLQERAARIVEDEVRHLFLENIETHRELIQEFNRLARKGNDHVGE
jgi:tetratricopeptide (TPR) repeat protein